MNNYYLQVSKLVLRQWFLNCASESRGGLDVLWHPGFAIICQDSLLARLRSLGQWGRPLS